MASPSSSSVTDLSDRSPESTTSSMTSLPTPCSPCSPSILLNPLPPARKQRTTVLLVSHEPSPPPAHFLKENPGYQAYPHSPPNASIDIRSRSSSADPHRHMQRSSSADSFTSSSSAGGGGVGGGASSSQEVCAPGSSDSNNKCLKFAPLPPGRRMYRSNSLSIGVAARARMINAQGGGPNMQQARYAGPQQWYQTGGVVPPDVYTYKDVQRGLGKIWNKVRKRSASTSSSTSTSEAVVMERDSKGKGKEIEHIEEASEEEDNGDDCSDDEDEERGRMKAPAVGLDLSGMDSESLSSTASDQPRTPEDSVLFEKPSLKGKEVEGQATSRAVAL